MLACLRVATRYLGLYVPNHIYSTIYKETWKEELMPKKIVIRGGGTGEAGEAAASPDFRG